MKIKNIEGQIVDVAGGVIIPGRVVIQDDRIAGIERRSHAPDVYILPGFIDSHIHIESSLLCPSRFSEAAVPHGTTCVITDPHEIANVLGMRGIEFMLKDSKKTPMRMYFTVPSCVPATEMETSGAILTWKEVRELLMLPEFVALGEVMNVQAVLTESEDMMKKIETAKLLGKPIDGHAPGLSGYDLDRYIFAGISTDHECVSSEEALEKHRKGMRIMVREGSTSKDLEPLAEFAKEHEFFFVSDDLHALDLKKGHIDDLLRKAVRIGIDPITAVRSVTLWPAKHYGLPLGSIAVGELADIVIVDNLRDFNVLQVYIGGKLVAEKGRALFKVEPENLDYHMVEQHISHADFEIRVDRDKRKVLARVIRVVPDQDISYSEVAELEVSNGVVQVDLEQDVLYVSVVCRYERKKPALGFIRGFKLKRGAIASSVAHDAHNIIAVGVDANSIATAVEYVSKVGGYCATNGTRTVTLELPIAGLMSAEDCDTVCKKEAEIIGFVRTMGCDLEAPFMTLSFQSLLVVPELKICDRGLFDSTQFKFVDPIIE
ncbi:MAG: adenine deaminase [Methanomassiliicoccales archaeon]|jgi:adenine deaminase|nr:adenine deaminase [Methanomassiliicoccales archaeon]